MSTFFPFVQHSNVPCLAAEYELIKRLLVPTNYNKNMAPKDVTPFTSAKILCLFLCSV